jgi:hypothetical protein
VIGITGGSFNQGGEYSALNLPKNINPWVAGLPAGLNASLTALSGSSLTVSFSGTPTAAAAGEIEIALPGSFLAGGSPTVVVGDSAFNIKYGVDRAAAVPTGGTFTLSPTLALAGETITLTVTPAEGYRYRSFSYRIGNTQVNSPAGFEIEEGEEGVQTITFPMPASPPNSHLTNLTVTFEQTPGLSMSYSPGLDTPTLTLSAPASSISKSGGGTLVITTALASGYRVSGWYFDGWDMTAVFREMAGITEAQSFPSLLNFSLDRAVDLGYSDITVGPHTITAIIVPVSWSGPGPRPVYSRDLNFTVTL